MLQTRVKDMEDKNIKLVNVVQVMLVRRILPCQHRACNLWEFDPAKHQTLLEFFGTMYEDISKVLFKSGKSWPDSAEDCGYKLSRPASSVSFSFFKVYPLFLYSRKTPKLPYLFVQGWTKEGGVDPVSGSAARRPSNPSSDEDAGSGAIPSAGEEGQGDQEWFPL